MNLDLFFEKFDQFPEDLEVKAWPVFYASSEQRWNQPENMPSDQEVMKRPFVVKPKAFDFEKEVRFVFPQKQYSMGGDLGATLNLRHLGFIQSVKISPYFHGGEDRAICDLIDSIIKSPVASPSLSTWVQQMEVNTSATIFPKNEPTPLCTFVKNESDSPSFFDYL